MVRTYHISIPKTCNISGLFNVLPWIFTAKKCDFEKKMTSLIVFFPLNLLSSHSINLNEKSEFFHYLSLLTHTQIFRTPRSSDLILKTIQKDSVAKWGHWPLFSLQALFSNSSNSFESWQRRTAHEFLSTGELFRTHESLDNIFQD